MHLRLPSVVKTAALLFALGLALPMAPQAQAATQTELYFNNGRIVKNCQLGDVVGDFIAYKCEGQQQVTTQRTALAHPYDTLTTKKGVAIVGQVMFTDLWTIEIRTPEGLQKLHKWRIESLALGNAVNPDGATAKQGSPIGGASGLNDAETPNAEATPLAQEEDETNENDTLAPLAPGAMPLAQDPLPEAEPTPKPEPALKPAKTKKAPIQRLITPATSPWRIDKPYDGFDRLY